MTSRLSAALLVLCLLAAWPAGAAVVNLPAGPVVGKTVSPQGDVEAFLGVPFAQPPVGPLRWRPPQPMPPWTQARECTEFGPSCPQPKSFLQPVEGAKSEDCLYLNVWRPAKRGATKLPVMVWIHGGGLTIGSGSKSYYNGAEFARQGVVLVTINYRLGPFGFFAHPALSEESTRGVSGNYGLLDQIAALRWVKQNIAALGGDPQNVTIFGESAGAVSVCCLLVSPLAEGLFHRAIPESGTADAVRVPLRGHDAEEMSTEATGRDIAGRLGIEGDGPRAAAALRAKTADELLDASNPRVGIFGRGTKFNATIDGYVLPQPPREMLAAGRFHHVPVMIGTNADEGTLFTKTQLLIRRPLGYRWLLGRVFGENRDRAEALFPVASADDVPEQLNRLVTVTCFTAPARRVARSLAAEGKSPVYLYYFSRVCPGLAKSGMGATHGSEIFYVFGTPPERFAITDVDRQLSAAMRETWVRFARTGDPNGGRLPRWQPFTPNQEMYLEFGDAIRPGTDLLKAECDLCNLIGPFALEGQAK